MVNKYLLENQYKANYESAAKFVNQNNLPDALDAYKRSLKALIDLIDSSSGSERVKYRAAADGVVESIKAIQQKMEVPKPTGKPAAASTAHPAAKPEKRNISIEDALKELDELEGLYSVKQQVRQFIDDVQYDEIRRKKNMPVLPKSRHMVFTGNPGTGKTTVARIMADILCALGIVSTGQLVEVDRKGLVGQYVGQTAIKTNEKIEEARGGVLFIDEAYGLNQGGENDFGKEAINTILTGMENYRDELVVIAAGYNDLMNQFIDSQPGFASRFVFYLHFEDYNGEQMLNIFNRMASKNGYVIDPKANDKLKVYFDKLYAKRDENFGNAREVRKLFEKIDSIHGKRIVQLSKQMGNLPDDVVKMITCEDIDL